MVWETEKGKAPGEIEFTPKYLPIPLSKAVKAGLSRTEDIEPAKTVFAGVRDSFLEPMGLGKEAHRKGVTDLLVPVGAGEALPNVEVKFGENDSDTTFGR